MSEIQAPTPPQWYSTILSSPSRQAIFYLNSCICVACMHSHMHVGGVALSEKLLFCERRQRSDKYIIL